ncbi:MAG: riboflavin kinase, partial [Tepidisphaeraceae bacterium]
HLIEGGSFTFGKGRGGNIDRLREWTAETGSTAGSGGNPQGIALDIVDPVTVPLLDLSVVAVSSSLIRWLLAHGRVRDAAICLGRPYALRGVVVEGFKRGRTIGAATANLRCDNQLVPGDGVYVGRCTIDGQTYPAAVSIGSLPTFDHRKLQVEAHLVGFNGDLYGQTLEVELLDWVREQRKFSGVEPLKTQIERDLLVVRARSTLTPNRPIAVA